MTAATAPTATDAGTVLDAALAHVARGWRIFPLHPDSKRPATPGHRASDCNQSDPWCLDGHTGWEARATTNPDRITRAWTHQPAYGIGIACGPSRLVVVDLDIPKDGEAPPEPWAHDGATCGADVLTLLAARHQIVIPATYTVRTISGGTHLYYTAPPGARITNSAGRLGWLIDIRATGGYVVAPPTTITGHTYTVLDDRPPAALPAWITHHLTTDPHQPPINRSAAPPPRQTGSTGRTGGYVAAAVAGETRKIREAIPGTRNHTLFVASVALGQLVAGNALNQTDARAALLDAAAAHARHGFTRHEAEATITSGLTAGAREPRTPPTTPKGHTTQ
ncbi:MAG: bifunctional DNA primase/polymerase [Nocardioides sp.]